MTMFADLLVYEIESATVCRIAVAVRRGPASAYPVQCTTWENDNFNTEVHPGYTLLSYEREWCLHKSKTLWCAVCSSTDDCISWLPVVSNDSCLFIWLQQSWAVFNKHQDEVHWHTWSPLQKLFRFPVCERILCSPKAQQAVPNFFIHYSCCTLSM